MANNFRTIYLYIVSLITLCMIVGGIVSTVNNIVSYFYPDSYVFFENTNSPSNYNSSYGISYDYNSAKENQIEQNNYKREKTKNAIVSIAVIIVGTIMYRYHWNLIGKERIK